MNAKRLRPLSVLLLSGIMLLAGCANPLALKGNKSEGLKLARLLRDQGRVEASVEVYARLDSRGLLKGPELLEYASVAAPVRTPQQALELYGRARYALGGDTSQMSSQEVLGVCLGIGRAQLALGRPTAAQQDFACALKAQPDNPAALNGMGVVLDAAGKHSEARGLFSKALHVNPADVAAANNMALSWLAEGNANKAIEQLRTTDATNPTSRLNLALAYLYADREEAARSTLAIIADPLRVDSLMIQLGARVQSLRESGNHSDALLLSSRQRLQLSSTDQ